MRPSLLLQSVSLVAYLRMGEGEVPVVTRKPLVCSRISVEKGMKWFYNERSTDKTVKSKLQRAGSHNLDTCFLYSTSLSVLALLLLLSGK